MEHHPLISFEDGLAITYSDIKQKKSGSEYGDIYFERPNQAGDDFNCYAAKSREFFRNQTT